MSEEWESCSVTYTRDDIAHIKKLLDLNHGSVADVFEIIDDEKNLTRDQLAMWLRIIEDVKDGKMEDKFEPK